MKKKRISKKVDITDGGSYMRFDSVDTAIEYWKKRGESIKDPLMGKLLEYLKIKGLGQAIVDGADLIVRLRLGQLNDVCGILERNCSIHQEGKGVDIEEPLYKAIEFGEYLNCFEKKGECDEADKCWITRKGFCSKRGKEDQ